MNRYIDEDALLKAVEGYTDMTRADLFYILEDIPTADVEEVRHGEWMLHKDGSGTCSECQFTQKNVWDFDNWQNFCGHCGAKMDGRREQ